MLRVSLLVSLLSIAMSLVSFANQVLIARYFGAGIRLDDYFLAASVPLLIIGSIVSLFSYEIVPILVRYRVNDNRRLHHFSGMLFLIWLFVGAGIPLLAYGMTPLIIRGMAPDLNGERLQITIFTARIFWVIAGGTVLINFFVAVHNSYRRFYISAASGIFPYLGMMIAAFVAAEQLGTEALAWGMLGGSAVAMLVLLAGIFREIKLDRETFIYFREAIISLRNVPMVFISVVCLTAHGAIDAFWAARLGAGLSYLGYGQRLAIALGGIILSGASTVLAPYLAEVAALGEHEKFRSAVLQAVRTSLFVSLPIAAIVVMLRVQILEILFQRGAFDSAATQGVALVMPGQFLGMVAMVCVLLMMKAMHARRDAIGASVIGAIGAVLYFLLSGLMSRMWGIQGIAGAYALSWWVLFGACCWRLFGVRVEKNKRDENLKFICSLMTAIVASSVVVFITTKKFPVPIDQLNRLHLFLRVGVSTLLGACCFLLISWQLFRMEELFLLFRMLPQRWSLEKIGT